MPNYANMHKENLNVKENLCIALSINLLWQITVHCHQQILFQT